MEALRRAYDANELDLAGATASLRDPAQWHAFINALFQTDWVVYAKPAFGGATAVLRYLGRYTHRVAISNHRRLAYDGERITFRWKDYTHDGEWRTMTLTAMEFLRRFVQHVLPRGFVRIRHVGYLASACRTTCLALARAQLASPPSPRSDPPVDPTPAQWTCPHCGGPMTIGIPLTPAYLMAFGVGVDTSSSDRLVIRVIRGDVPTHLVLSRRRETVGGAVTVASFWYGNAPIRTDQASRPTHGLGPDVSTIWSRGL